LVSRSAFTLLVALVTLERLFELRLSKRNERRLRAQGAVEFGAGHYPVMVALHVILLAGSVVECWLLSRPFVAWLGYPMLGVVLLAAAGRFWVIRTLGQRWTTRVIVPPESSRITQGPYRYLDHPNYVVVVAEGFALPLVHTSWITALVFSIANAILLRSRVRIENQALKEAADG